MRQPAGSFTGPSRSTAGAALYQAGSRIVDGGSAAAAGIDSPGVPRVKKGGTTGGGPHRLKVAARCVARLSGRKQDTAIAAPQPYVEQKY